MPWGRIALGAGTPAASGRGRRSPFAAEILPRDRQRTPFLHRVVTPPAEGGKMRPSRSDEPQGCDLLKIGDVIDGKYRLVRLLGEGGMGAVYEVRHEMVGQRYALKCLHAHHSTDETMVQRFVREAQTASAIGSEHIVYITDGGRAADGCPYLVMEYLEGEDLASVLHREGRLAPRRAVALMGQICEALGPAHARGIVHRDLKPANIFLIQRAKIGDWVKILDFGIAKVHQELTGPSRSLTRTGSTMGTPFYMAPEQFRESKNVDHRADIYSAGVILFEMLTGRVPFQATTYEELIVQVVTATPVAPSSIRPELSPECDHVVARAMAREPERRFGDMDEMLHALSSLTGEGAATVETSEPAPSGPPGTDLVQEEQPRPFPGTAVVPASQSGSASSGTPPKTRTQNPGDILPETRAQDSKAVPPKTRVQSSDNIPQKPLYKSVGNNPGRSRKIIVIIGAVLLLVLAGSIVSLLLYRQQSGHESDSQMSENTSQIKQALQEDRDRVKALLKSRFDQRLNFTVLQSREPGVKGVFAAVRDEEIAKIRRGGHQETPLGSPTDDELRAIFKSRAFRECQSLHALLGQRTDEEMPEFIAMTDRNGLVISRDIDPSAAPVGENARRLFPAIKTAIQGEPTHEIRLWNNFLIDVSMAPVLVKNTVLGVLLIGHNLSYATAQKIGETIGSDLVFVVFENEEWKLHSFTFSSEDRAAIREFISFNNTKIGESIESSGEPRFLYANSEQNRIGLGGKISPHSDSSKAGFIVLRHMDE